MKVKDYLKINDDAQFHIFDSHQEGMLMQGKEHGDQDYVLYTYNIHRNNKPKAGDAFLYRRPGKSSKTRNFYIYGGGVIESISAPDKDGNVHAKITQSFKLEEIIEQGSIYLENFKWTFKQRKNNSWLHFWNQYGMNVINRTDFFNLVGDLDCEVPTIYTSTLPSIAEAAEENEITNVINEVSIHTDDDTTSKLERKSSRKVSSGIKVDFTKIHDKNMKLGELGELMVLELLKSTLNPLCIIEHSSKEVGDGLGYDIKVVYPDGKITYIEVKTTKSNRVDQFYVTPNEQKFARECKENEEYFYYRVYNFKDGNASLKIYDGPLSESVFNLVPTAYKVYVK